MAIIVPDIILQNTLEAILVTIQANWNANSDKTKTALYRMWNGITHGDYDYYVQAQEVFLRTDADKRKINIRSRFPRDKQEFPCVVVNVPSESSGGPNSLGFNTNSSNVVFDTSEITFEQNNSRSFEFTYSILIFSDNRNEVSLIYHTIKSFFIIKQIYEHLTLSGFENLRISGRELQRMSDIPNGTFIRAIQLSGFTTQVVDELTANAMIQDLNFTGTITENITV